jgi:hypothetical protein
VDNEKLLELIRQTIKEEIPAIAKAVVREMNLQKQKDLRLGHVSTEEEQLATVFATQGIKGLKKFFENMPVSNKEKSRLQ